jgi:hypothetical protein
MLFKETITVQTENYIKLITQNAEWLMVKAAGSYSAFKG